MKEENNNNLSIIQKMKKEIDEMNKKMNLSKEQYNNKNKELMDEIKKKRFAN